MVKRILYLGLDPTHYSCQGEITHWPIIQIIPRPFTDPLIQQALSNFTQYSHILVTSKSTVTILQAYLSKFEINLQIWAEKMTLAVGQATAKKLKAMGMISLKVAQKETAEGLIEELKQLPLGHAHIFWPHSAKARPVIQQFLMAENIRHTTCILYDPCSIKPEKLPILETFDEIVFTSPSTVESFLEIYGKLPPPSQCAVIGPITAYFLDNMRNL